ncbi:MAG: cyclodeaminase/cyclohydrolase family protein [Candidatus Thermoplasmatota archaeon]
MLKGFKGLEAFCKDLASDQPAPGGGSASAAAGAMAASLLSMVCGVTLKSKKHEANWPKLALLRRRADSLSGLLLRTAEADSAAYVMLVIRAKAKRADPSNHKAVAAFDASVRSAMDIPASTAEQCLAVLRLSQEVAALGTKSASSDIEVARLLAAAGVDGAVANVMVNIPSCSDHAYAARAKEAADEALREKARLIQG